MTLGRYESCFCIVLAGSLIMLLINYYKDVYTSKYDVLGGKSSYVFLFVLLFKITL